MPPEHSRRGTPEDLVTRLFGPEDNPYTIEDVDLNGNPIHSGQDPNPELSSETNPDSTPSPDTPRSRWQFGRYSGRTAIAGVLLVASGAVVLHEEPVSPESTQTVAETLVPHTVYRTGGDGVWLHDSPGLNTPLKVVMPEGSQFNVDCFVTGGDNVNGNKLWLQGEYNGTPGAVTDYYVSTKWNTTQDLVNQGIEECGTNPNPPGLQERAPQQPGNPEMPVDGGSVFYAPGNGGMVADFGTFNSPATVTMANDGGSGLDWSQGENGSCNTQGADDFPETVEVFNGPDKRITTLGGWSIGRLGPAYFLQETGRVDASADSLQKRDNISYIVLLDPGSKNEYNSVCDVNARQSMEMAAWLREDPNNNLVIFAGIATTDAENYSQVGDKKYMHQGIQEGLFRASIRGQAEITDQVVVCNYGELSHKATYDTFKGLYE